MCLLRRVLSRLLMPNTCINLSQEYEPEDQTEVIPYDGDEPYLIVWFAPEDQDRVMPILRRMVRDGYRIWFSTETDEYRRQDELKKRLDGPNLFAPVFTKNFFDSAYCIKEWGKAFNQNKDVAYIEIEKCEEQARFESNFISIPFKLHHYDPKDHRWFFFDLYREPGLEKTRQSA